MYRGIAEGQAFLDGNKRTALLAVRAFYGLNGFHFAIPLDAGWELAEYVTNADPFDARVLAAGFSRYRVPVRPLDDS